MNRSGEHKPVTEHDKSKPFLELGIEFVVELLLFLYPYGAEQMSLPHNFWLGLGCWLVGTVIAVRMFWIFPAWKTRLSPLEKGLIAFIGVGLFALAVYQPITDAYKARNAGTERQHNEGRVDSNRTSSKEQQIATGTTLKSENGGKEGSHPPSRKIKPNAPQPLPQSHPAQALPPQLPTQTCAAGASCGQSFGQSGGVTAGTINIGTVSRHLEDQDRIAFISKLSGFTSKVHFGVVYGVADGYQFEDDLSRAIKEAHVTVMDDVMPLSWEGGKKIYGVEVQYHGDPLPDGQIVTVPFESQPGIMIGALHAGHVFVSGIHCEQGIPADEVRLVVSFPPSERLKQP